MAASYYSHMISFFVFHYFTIFPDPKGADFEPVITLNESLALHYDCY